MELSYQCPKCGGGEYYFAKRQLLKGKGVFIRAKLVDTPLCKNCGEVANRIYSDDERMSQTVNLAANAKFFGFLLLGTLLFFTILLLFFA